MQRSDAEASIVQAGTPVLRERAAEVTREQLGAPAFAELVRTMIGVMQAAPGVGLAAPQIGVGLRIFVLEDRADFISGLTPVEIRERERVAFAPRVFVNPVLRAIGDERVGFFEGCLSVRGYAGYVERAIEVEVSGLDELGQAQTWRVRGWPARILQHEHDHLDGKLYVDRMLTRSFAAQDIARARYAGRSIAELRALLGLA